jgi:hypothetical protein
MRGPRSVCFHEDRCTKNKRMIWIAMHGLFLTCTENSFLFCTHTYIILKQTHICLEENVSTWKGDHLFMVVNSHPHRSLAWNQVPLHPCISLTARTCFLPIEHLFYIQTTLTSPILLLGTRRFDWWKELEIKISCYCPFKLMVLIIEY